MKIHQLIQIKCFLVTIGLMVSFVSFGQTTNLNESFGFLINDKSLVWSEETNNFRTGTTFISSTGEINVWALKSTYSGLVYVYPPSGKLPKLELRDTNGIAIRPIDNRSEGELPQRLTEKALRKYHSNGLFRERSVSYDYFMIAQNAPALFKTFAVSDAFQIKKAGDYTLTVFPVIYRFETNREYADRIDLPSVSTKIHFKPSL